MYVLIKDDCLEHYTVEAGSIPRTREKRGTEDCYRRPADQCMSPSTSSTGMQMVDSPSPVARRSTPTATSGRTHKSASVSPGMPLLVSVEQTPNELSAISSDVTHTVPLVLDNSDMSRLSLDDELVGPLYVIQGICLSHSWLVLVSF